jgi:hypothetical protein
MRARRVVLGCLSAAVLALAVAATWLVGGGALASASTQGVRLVLAHPAWRAGRSIAVTVVNDTRSQILRGFCFELQRQVGRGWATVTRTHGIAFPCVQIAGVTQPARTRAPVGLPLYDDLLPGEYRITLRYKPAHGVNLGNLTGPKVRSVHARVKVLAYRPGPRPTLSERRILTLAEQAASRSGDPNPTLIQHAAGTRFEAVVISSGDLIFEYNWSYLIAIRGHFTATNASYLGAKPPTGTVITLVVDARTGQVTDGGIGNRYPPLAKLGPVTTDLRAVGDGSFPDAPRTQPGSWPAGFPCPLAPPNRYLPARAGCVTVERADVDGDGRPDLILLYANLGPNNSGTGFVPRGFTLKVVRASGGVLTARVPHLENDTILRVRNVNGRPGAEIFIQEGRISSGSFAGVYTFDGRRLLRAGGFTYGGDSGQRYGFVCRPGRAATITQYAFLLEQGPIATGRWQRTITTHEWHGAQLQRAATTTTTQLGAPPDRFQGAHC